MYANTTYITAFVDKYRFLSNFYLIPISFEGITYPSVEHAYQAMKTTDIDLRIKISRAVTANAAKRIGRTITLRPDWEDVKNNYMAALLLIKFSYPDLKQKLLETDDLELVEGNHWHDNYWGMCWCKDCVPLAKHNHLGKLLMEIRSKFQGEPLRQTISDETICVRCFEPRSEHFESEGTSYCTTLTFYPSTKSNDNES